MVVNLIAMPFMSIGLLPLVVIFYCLRNYYLKTSSEIKRLETSGNYDSILLQRSVRSSRPCPLSINDFDSANMLLWINHTYPYVNSLCTAARPLP